MPLPDIAELPQITARARRHAERFALPLRDQNWRGSLGEMAGTGTGSSLEFQDHRVYVPGDDPRHINWAAYARTGDYSIKLYRKEVRPSVDLLFDVSESMFEDSAKRIRAMELLLFSLCSAERAGASLRLFLLKGSQWKSIPDAISSAYDWVRLADGLDGTAASAPPDCLDALPLRVGSLRVLISDLLFPGSPESVLRNLTRQSGRSIILAPFAQDEVAPPWRGPCELIDTEAATIHVHRIDDKLLARYTAAYRAHFDLWKAATVRAGIPMARIASDLDFATTVQSDAIPRKALVFL